MAGSNSEEAADTNHPAGLEQKLNQILEHQRSKASVAADSTATNPVSKNSVTEQDVDKLKSEIYNLRQQLNEVQTTSGSSNTVNNSQVSEASAADEIKDDSSPEMAKASEAMVVKVKELESRLAEYEIIADDIAELSQLRADNAKLKEQLSQMQPKNVQTADVPTAPAEPATASQEAATDLSGQAMVDALFAEANTSTAQADSAVPDGDQNLLNEFEKITQKKGNE